MLIPACPKSGVIPIAVYWFEWALLLVPFAFALYCIYLATLLANGYWLTAIGSGPLVCTCISMILAFGVTAIHALYQFSLMPSAQSILKLIQVAGTVCALISYAVLLTFFTPTELSRNQIDFTEYTERYNATDASAGEYWMMGHTQEGQYEIETMIWDRSIAPKLPLVSFFAVWLASFVMYVLGWNLSPLRDTLEQNGRADETPLNPAPVKEDEQDEPEIENPKPHEEQGKQAAEEEYSYEYSAN